MNGDFFAVAVETGVRRKRQHFEDMVDRHVEVERSGKLDVFERLAAEGDADAVEILDHPGDLRQVDVAERAQPRGQLRLHVDRLQRQVVVRGVVGDFLPRVQSHDVVRGAEIDGSLDQYGFDVGAVVVGFQVEFGSADHDFGVVDRGDGERRAVALADFEKGLAGEVHRAVPVVERGRIVELRTAGEPDDGAVGQRHRAVAALGADRADAVVRPVLVEIHACDDHARDEDGGVARRDLPPLGPCFRAAQFDAPLQRSEGLVGVDRRGGTEPVSGEEHEVERFEPAAVLLRGVVPVFDLAVGGFVEFSFEKFGQQVVVDLFHKFGF